MSFAESLLCHNTKMSLSKHLNVKKYQLSEGQGLNLRLKLFSVLIRLHEWTDSPDLCERYLFKRTG